MKTFQILFLALTLSLSISAQRMLDIQGSPIPNLDTVVTITGNVTGQVQGMALYVSTKANVGVAGSFFGKSTGVVGEATFGEGVKGKAETGEGVYGKSTSGYGVYGESTSSTGAYFEGGDGVAIELGGSNSVYGNGDDDGVIRSQENQTGGDLIFVSNDYLDLHIDDDDNSNSLMRVKNGKDAVIFSLSEAGNLTLMGSCSCSSDRNRKEQIAPISTKDILAKVSDLPIKQWYFKGEKVKHIGPMAQDFYAAFGLGQGETTIATVDADGVALAAIQALKKEVDDLTLEVHELKTLLYSLNRDIKK